MNDVLEQLDRQVTALPPTEGLSPSALTELPTELAALLQHLLRNTSMSVATLADAFHYPSAEFESIVETLVNKGYLHKIEDEHDARYKIRLARKTPHISGRAGARITALLNALSEDA